MATTEFHCPSVSFTRDTEGKHSVQFTSPYGLYSLNTKTARTIATDLLTWAKRVDEMNGENDDD